MKLLKYITRLKSKQIISLFSIVLIVSFLIPNITFGQEADTSSSSRSKVSFHESDSTKIDRDTSHVQHNVDAALDIASDRGIFILSADRMLQLRILGSVRANFNYSDQDLGDHNTFNPYEIPTRATDRTPNFYAGIEQTRLGFEVTRRTKTKGDIFIRLEGDFKNSSVAFRIRHAYGQFGNWLIGQTWSLMANVAYQPAFVSMDGPSGGSGIRTPQIRYSRNINKKMVWNVAIEYAFDGVDIPDSIGTTLQVIPDFTGSYSYITDKFSFRVSGIIRTLSGKTDSSSISYFVGWGGSFAGKAKLRNNGEIFLGITAGKAISSFLDIWSGRHEDMTYNSSTQTFDGLISYSGYLAFSYTLPLNLSASLSLGTASIQNTDFQSDNAYNASYNLLFDIFWTPVQGARLGLEFANGARIDKNNERGYGNRLSILMYYDF